MEPAPEPRIKLWHIVLIMMACGFGIGLLFGLIQTIIGIYLPNAAVGAVIGGVGGLMLARRWAKARSHSKRNKG